MPNLRRYGARPSPFDARDFKYSRLETPQKRPPVRDVFRYTSPVFNQGDEGSCVANAGAGAIEFHIPGFIASRSFMYRECRVAQHDLHGDDGCDPRTFLEAVRKHGAPPEKDWPYDGKAPDQSEYFAKRPGTHVFKEAKKLVLGPYEALGQKAGVLNDMLDCIGNLGLPVMIGVAVYTSFESDECMRTGDIPLPGPGEQLLGYHELLAGAYDDKVRRIKVRNSWDTDVGVGGYFTIPYDYASNIKLLTDANVVTAAHLA